MQVLKFAVATAFLFAVAIDVPAVHAADPEVVSDSMPFKSPNLEGDETKATEAAPLPGTTRVEVSYGPGLKSQPVTGRLLLFVSFYNEPSPRLQSGQLGSTQVFGIDVDALTPGKSVVIDETTAGYPTRKLSELQDDSYYIQAVLNVYTQLHRADGHVIWAHQDQWEGQQAGASPGNLVSAIYKVHLSPYKGYDIHLTLDRVLPPVKVPEDTAWVKHVKIQSKLLTAFWGHPMYLGATVLLPKGYEGHPDQSYPVLYWQDHFSLQPPLQFTTEKQRMEDAEVNWYEARNMQPGYELYKAWSGPGFPRMLIISFLHPTPYYDDSYAVDSQNDGPYGKAITQELIPYLESHFRVIPAPYARLLSGGSTGGWEALALQVQHPDLFGGVWAISPDPVDFHHLQLLDLYHDANAYRDDQGVEGQTSMLGGQRPVARGMDGAPVMSMVQVAQLQRVMGSHGRSGQQFDAWFAAFDPVGADGYPEPMWDPLTGKVDPSVVEKASAAGYDLTAYLRAHWSELGPKLAGKLHVSVGTLDTFYLDPAVRDLQTFLDQTTAPKSDAVIVYGLNRPHPWLAVDELDLLREMADHAAHAAPAGADLRWLETKP
jgi:hypothetical protein